MPGMCILSALPVNLGVPLPYGRDNRRVLKKMLGLVEGGGLPTVAELVKKYEEEGEEEEEQGEQPPAAGKTGLSEAPEPAEVRPVGRLMLLGDAQEEKQEVPASRRAQWKEHTVQVTPPRRRMRRWCGASRHRRRRGRRRGGGRMLPPWWW